MQNRSTKIAYRIYPCIICTFFSQILPPKSRCALYTELFVFMLGNLHNNTKSAKSNSFNFMQQVEINQDRSLSVASVMQLVYDYNWKPVALSRVFQWQSKFNEECSFRLCKSMIHSLIFWFFEQMQKDLKEKRSCKSSSQHHLESYHVATSLVPELLVQKFFPGVVQMDHVRSCSSKTAEENKEKVM